MPLDGDAELLPVGGGGRKLDEELLDMAKLLIFDIQSTTQRRKCSTNITSVFSVFNLIPVPLRNKIAYIDQVDV
ncbi:MAG: hypothetical protein AAF492_28425 [Verrucomicrobiota bacterium]